MPAYIKFDGIDGEVVEGGYEKWIALNSFSWGATQSGSAASTGGGGTGKVQFQDFHFDAAASKASPKLAESICQGKHFPKVELHLVSTSADGQRYIYLKYEMSSVVVVGYNVGGSEDDVPMDSVDLRLGAAVMSVGDVSGVVGPCTTNGRPGR